MKRIRILGLGLAGAFAFSVVASSATASPVFYTKVAMGGTASAPIKFTGTMGVGDLEGNVSKAKIECAGGTMSGEVTGPTTARNIVATFTSCQGSFTCNSAGEKEGIIKTHVLEGELGDVKVGVPGLRLFNEATGRGGELATFSCGGGAILLKVRGSVIGQLSGASGDVVSEGKFAAAHKLSFAEKGGIQTFSRFLGEEATEQLETKVTEGGYEKSGLVGVATLTAEGVSNLGFTK